MGVECRLVPRNREKMEQATMEAAEAVSEKMQQHGDAFTGFVGDVQADVLSSISAQSVGPEGFVENFQGDVCLTVHFVFVHGIALHQFFIVVVVRCPVWIE